ncbi:DUF418 domain-containing protein [Variovorax durovernensis]
MTFDPARLPRYSAAGGSLSHSNTTASRARTSSTPGPAPVTRRVELLDALRGFALLGVLLVDARSITLFTLLFGVGFTMQLDGTRLCVRRMLVLPAIGLALACLFWWGDIGMRTAAWSLALFLLGPLLIGMAVGRARVLQESVAHRRFWVRLLRASFGVSVIAGTLLVLRNYHGTGTAASWLHDGAGLVLARLLREIARLAQGLFCMAGFVLLFQQAAWRRWLRKLAPMGRMALTNFLGQTLFGLGLFYGIGLGPGPQFGLADAALAALAIFGLQALFSCWWLGRFRFGPAEWVWHSLVRGEPQPMRLPALPASQGGVALVMRSVAGGTNGLPALM